MKYLLICINLIGVYFIAFTLYFFIIMFGDIGRLPVKSDLGRTIFKYSSIYSPVVLLALVVLFSIIKRKVLYGTLSFWLYLSGLMQYI